MEEMHRARYGGGQGASTPLPSTTLPESPRARQPASSPNLSFGGFLEASLHRHN